MKKCAMIIAAILALTACSKESPVKEESAIDASKLVFNIDVQRAGATKGVKTAWESGDVVYVFFQDNTTQYVKMTYNGTSWSSADKDGGSTFTGLTLAASGKYLSAVYFPAFVCAVNPAHNGSVWSFGDIEGYFQKAVTDYTVTSTDDVNTLNATINLTVAPDIVQLFIPSSEFMAPGTGEEYVLTATNIKPCIFQGVVPGSDASYGSGSVGFPLTGYSGTIDSETGYYFWGFVENASLGATDYSFQLVKRNAEKKYAISSYAKTVTSKNLTGSAAIKLTGLTDNGNFVSLGYTGGPLWATGNLDKTNRKIVDPLEAGEYFKYGYTTPYSSSDPEYTGDEDPLSADHDAAYQANNAWRIPTEDELRALIKSDNTDGGEWKADWTNIGGKGGRLFTSKVNGISLFFASVGYYNGASLSLENNNGNYWSSTPSVNHRAYYLDFNNEGIIVVTDLRDHGYSVRPVSD